MEHFAGVEDQGRGVRRVHQLTGEGTERHLEGQGGWRIEQRGDTLYDPRYEGFERSQHVEPETHGIIVALVQRYPGRVYAWLRDPLRHERRLAEPRRRTHDSHRPLD